MDTAAQIGIGVQTFNTVAVCIMGAILIGIGILYKPHSRKQTPTTTTVQRGGLIAFGVLIIVGSTWNLKMMKKHKGYAAVAGVSDVASIFIKK